MVLKNCEPGGSLELLVVESQQVRFGLLDLVEHFFPQLLGGLDLLPFFLIDFVEAALVHLDEFLLQLGLFFYHLGLLLLELLGFLRVVLQLHDYVVKLAFFHSELGFHDFNLLVKVLLHLVAVLHRLSVGGLLLLISLRLFLKVLGEMVK